MPPKSTNKKIPVKKPVKTPKVTRAEVVTQLDFGGNIDKIRILAYPFQEQMTILDDVLLDFNWAEDASELASVQATITFKNIGDFAKNVLKRGTWLYPQYLDPATDEWKYLDPPLYVWERSRTDITRQVSTVTAFDIVSFVNRQDTANWVFKDDKQHKGGWYAHEIARKILFELEIRADVVRGKYKIPYLYLQSHNPLEVILKAYTRDRQISNIMYRLQAVGKKVTIQPFTKQERTWVIEEGINLIDSEWNESLDELYTEVVVISTSQGENGEIINGGARAISPKVREYGRIRNVVYLEKKVSQAALKKFAEVALKYVEKGKDTINITAEGLIPLRAGDAVYIKDRFVGLEGKFFVRSINHSVTAGNHTMDIEIQRAAVVPVLYPSRDELVKSGSTTPLIGTRSVEGPLGVAWFPPTGTKKGQTTRTAGQGPHAQGTTWMEISAVDIKLPSGSPVYASQSGVIKGVTQNNTGHMNGTRIFIEGSQGGRKPTVFYAGLAALEPGISNGARVSVGEQIAQVGHTGILHIALSKGSYDNTDRNMGIDPQPFINPTITNTQDNNNSTPQGSTTAVSAGPQSTTPVTSGDNTDLRIFARKLAIAYKINANFFEKQIQQESGFSTNNPVSSAGAGGIAQIVLRFHPLIAPYVGKDPKRELNYAAWYMAKLLVGYNRRWDLALAGYNAGVNAVAQAGNKVPSYQETRDYVLTITGTLGPTTQTVGPAPNNGGALKFPPGIS